ncbi:MAG: restriction endonuclease, partial [Deltaproteobacteria bacterium]|nr:restriction endonuclease [Deltaproteobacteria bacterium]
MVNYINNLFDQRFIEGKINSFLPKINNINGDYEFCYKLFTGKSYLDSFNEASVQEDLIFPIIKRLGWFYRLQESKVISETTQIFDAVLFSDQDKYENYLKIDKDTRKSVYDGIDIILESKALNVTLDNHKASKDSNPYFQLLDYLQKSRLTRGFLTNGRQWYLVDNSVVSRDKKYLAFFLDKILEEGDQEGFALFWRFFHAANYNQANQAKLAKIDEIAQKAEESRREIESNIRNLIYGYEGRSSLFEEIGRTLFQACDLPTEADNLKLIFENSLFFIFRLMFVAYFEDHCRDILESHEAYKIFSLKQIIQRVKSNPDPSGHNGWGFLKRLFATLDQGDPELKIYLLDGGLFNPTNAPLLSLNRVFNDEKLCEIFDKLFRFGPEGEELIRDFSAFSPAHLGTIYEGLLEFEFRVAEENLFETFIQVGNEKIEGYYDEYDVNCHDPSQVIIIRKLLKGELYLVNSHNNRKVSGSYYTPDSLAYPLVTQGVELQLDGPFKDRSILEMRVLDCACGSGHLLIVALNVLARKALDRLNTDSELKDALAKEMEAIKNNYIELGLDPNQIALDEFAVLKRVLLKKTIYGVDLSPFAAELTRMSLWIDTFIYGTPLSFIEHHIKSGNSLIGSDYESLIAKSSSDLFDNNIKNFIEKNISEINSLNFLNDTTSKEVIESNDKYFNKILPSIKNINYYIDFIIYLDFLRLKNISPIPPIFAKLNANYLGKPTENMSDEKLTEHERECEKYRETFGFFNWKVEFLEVFPKIDQPDDPANGFNLIIGNPPWDKTKFEEPLFFAQYRSKYRTSPNSKKKEIALDLLAKPDIKRRYEREKERTELTNAYFKTKFPLNRGAGDNNLFRFFVERALGLLAPRGGLSYIVPTGLLTEDGSYELRKNILENYRLKSFDGFENRRRIFPDVHASYKFGLIHIEKVREPNQVAQTRFMLTDPAALATDEGRFPYSLADIKASSPKHLAFLETSGGAEDLKILIKLHKKFSHLEPTWLDFRRELDATNDKSLFRESNKPGFIPLYKGEMIWQYQAYQVPPKYWLDPTEF